MKTRIISAVFALVVFFAVMLSESLGFVADNSLLIAVVITALCAMSLYEMYAAIGLKNKTLYALGIVLALAMLHAHISGGETGHILLCIYVVLALIVLVFSFERIKFETFCAAVAMTVAIVFLFDTIVRLRYEFGLWAVWLVTVLPWLCDTGAYFIGMAFGKKKLTEHISPKKTVAGAVGGWIFSVLAAVIFGIIAKNYYEINAAKWAALIAFGAAAGIASQLGDLAFSAVKRSLGVKDYGSIMPGHGGVLDRFDSVLFVAALAYASLYYFS